MTESTLSRLNLVVKKSPIHGYGVFAGEDIKAGDIIEECYAVILAKNDPYIENYSFNGDGKIAMVLGYGAIYNHSTNFVNATYEFDKEKSAMIFRARRRINKGEEIFIHYGDGWFGNRRAIVKEPSMRYKVRYALTSIQTFLRGLLVTSALTALIIICQLYFSTRV